MGIYEIFRIATFIFILENIATTNGADLRCYEGSFDKYTVYALDNASPFLSSPYYHSERKTVIYAFGFLGTPTDPSVQRIVELYLGTVNICVLNWEKEVQFNVLLPLAYRRSMRNTRRLGREFGDTLIELFEAGLSPSKVHLIGHSLGAQLFGYTGREVIEDGYTVERITGLDPAGPLYDGIQSVHSLGASDARFVDVIHGNPGAFGTDENRGTVDIWANCEDRVQPGCRDSSLIPVVEPDVCSHFRACYYFAEALERPTAFEARAAASCEAWRAGRGGNETVYLGDKINTNARGVYYMRTSLASPYGLGPAGSQPDNQ